jgi:hypothetical protein
MIKKNGPVTFDGLPESWHCVDCGVNTAPGFPNRREMEIQAKRSQALERMAGKDDWEVPFEINDLSEVYTVRPAVWERAGMEPMGGCLCIGCLEKRLGRRLRPKDFLPGNGFNAPHIPGTERLMQRRYER